MGDRLDIVVSSYLAACRMSRPVPGRLAPPPSGMRAGAGHSTVWPRAPALAVSTVGFARLGSAAHGRGCGRMQIANAILEVAPGLFT